MPSERGTVLWSHRRPESDAKSHPRCGWLTARATLIPLVGLWRRRFGRPACLRGPVTAFRHELVELDLVLGVAQAIEEIAEIALLLFEPPQRLGAVFIEGTVAAGRRGAPPVAAGA